MSRIFKKILIIGTTLIAILLFYNIVIFTITNSAYSYKIILGKNTKFDSLFNPNFIDSISVTSVIGNEYEQIYFYNYSDNYRIVIWNISGFIDIDLSKNHLFIVDDLRSVVFPNKNYSDIGRYTLSSRLSPLVLKKINVYAEKGMDLISHEESKYFSYMDISSRGIAIGNKEEFVIKLESDEMIHYNIGFINGQSGFQLIIISKDQGEIIEDNLFFKLFRLQSTQIRSTQKKTKQSALIFVH